MWESRSVAEASIAMQWLVQTSFCGNELHKTGQILLEALFLNPSTSKIYEYKERQRDPEDRVDAWFPEL
jgi:hypothetical protein